MTNDFIDYGKLIDDAMRLVVHQALEHVLEHGLPGDHHFFITFSTHHPGVMMSDELIDKYPAEMTIVVQHQYWDLEVTEDHFSIVLSFGNIKQNLTIPFDAVISFADPSVKFGLQFSNALPDDDDLEMLLEGIEESKEAPEPITDGSNVVTLDAFRKK